MAIFRASTISFECERCHRPFAAGKGGVCSECHRALCNAHLYDGFLARVKAELLGTPVVCPECRAGREAGRAAPRRG